jgi:hypothetical protein
MIENTIKMVKSKCIPIHYTGVPELSDLIVGKKSYYFTLELAKQLNANVVFLMKAVRETESFRVIYSYVELAQGFYLDGLGYFKSLNERFDMLSKICSDLSVCTPIVLTLDGAKKVLKDNGYAYTNIELKRACRFFIRNYSPVCFTKNTYNAGFKFTSIYYLNFNDMINRDLFSCGDYTNANVFYLLLSENDNKENGVEFVDEGILVPIKMIKDTFVESIGWYPNDNWYERKRHQKYR